MKLCWQGLDKWASPKQLAKFVTSLLPDTSGISMHKPHNKPFAFFSFSGQPALDDFLATLSAQTFHKRPIKLKSALESKPDAKFKPLASFLQERPIKVSTTPEPLGPIEFKVTPLCLMPYSEQLIEKSQIVLCKYQNLLSQLRKTHQKEDALAPV